MQQLFKAVKSILISLLIIPILIINCYAIEDAIVAVVNNELLTLKDLKNYILSTQASLVTEGIPEEKIKAIMDELQNNGLNKLIEDKLILSRANDIGLEVQDKLVNERIKAIKLKYESEQQFFDALIKNGTNITELKNKYRDQFKIQFVIEHEVKAKIYVNPQEVTDFYQNNKELFQKKQRVLLESIYIAYSNNKTAAQAKANEALGNIKSGKDFLETAKIYSDSPSLGEIEKGQLMPSIEDIIFNMEVGEVSSPVEVDTGIYIFKIAKIIEPKIAPLVEVKDKIYNYVYQNKLSENFRTWLEELKKDAYIEIKK
ncbi:MAG: peptidyl-prolyl cis-trans isomerase, partial [Candidatus Omnitrophica bacterium]|nr:peptidyl-prolyl cis-trans isomerase [Candidatus Omnitrophota bacterium]MBU1997653.1 peptidyl-prolyl cis-trans isomerase [Candidatus Omnitrophota bacterium]